MLKVTTLVESDLPAAIEVMAEGIGEIPLYRWLLGDHVDDRGKREWLAMLLLRPLLRVGCAAGAHIDGELVGVLAWRPHDVDLAPDGRPPLTVDDVAVAVQTPGLRERLLELWTGPQLPSPVEDAVNCLFVTLRPDIRGGRVLLELMGTVERYCLEHERPFYAWTGSPPLRDWFLTGWDTTQFATTEWHGVPMYGVVSKRLSPVSHYQRV